MAVDVFQQAITLNPHCAEYYYNLGNALKGLGKIESALERYKSAIRLKPSWADVYYNLAHAASDLGRIDDAIDGYQKSIKLNPGFLDAYINLGVIYQEKGKLDRALACYQTALKLDATCSDALNNMGLTYRAMGDQNEAISCFEKAFKFNRDCIDALINLGQVYQENADLQKAGDTFMQALSVQPSSVEAFYHLVRLKTEFDRKGAIDRLGKVEKKDLSDNHRIMLQYTLGQLHEDISNYDKAFFHFKWANELEKELCAGQFNVKDIEGQFLGLINLFNSDFFAKRRHFGVSSQLPVFIVGMPRSGTTLVDQIISSHPLVWGAGELPNLRNLEKNFLNRKYGNLDATRLHSLDNSISNDLAHRYLTQLKSYSKDAIRITDKYPHNFMRLGLIALFFPNAKIIHCRRNPIDTCVSCYFTKFTYGHAYKHDLRNLGLYYGLYQRLMDHWHDVLPVPILDVHYEELIGNQNEVSRQIIDFCDLQWMDCCLEFYNNKRPVLTASYSQVRRKIYATSAGRWKRYEKHLDELIDALKPPHF